MSLFFHFFSYEELHSTGASYERGVIHYPGVLFAYTGKRGDTEIHSIHAQPFAAAAAASPGNQSGSRLASFFCARFYEQQQRLCYFIHVSCAVLMFFFFSPLKLNFY